MLLWSVSKIYTCTMRFDCIESRSTFLLGLLTRYCPASDFVTMPSRLYLECSSTMSVKLNVVGSTSKWSSDISSLFRSF